MVIVPLLAMSIDLADYWYHLLFPALAVPILLLAAARGLYPTGRALLLFLAPFLFAVLFFLMDIRDVLWIAAVLDGVLFTLLLADLLSLASLKGLDVSRTMERVSSLGQKQEVSLTLANRTRFGRTLEVRDDAPEEVAGKAGWFPGRFFLRAGEQEVLTYSFRPAIRGRYQFPGTWLAVSGLLGLWRAILFRPGPGELDVYPNLRQIREYDLLARSDRLHLLGVRKTRRSGQDNDFERLRDYRPGDMYRFMDWKATARRQKLTVREFQTSRSQRVMFLIDTGRMMTNLAPAAGRRRPDSGSEQERALEALLAGKSADANSARITMLDHALNAMLMLAYIALKQGDEVGFLAFSNNIRQYIPARGGMDQMNRLIHGSFDLFPEEQESRYDTAFRQLQERCPKRSLVILLTNVCDERNAAQVERQLRHLMGRHLPLGIFLRDHALFDAVRTRDANDTDENREQLYRAGAASEILLWRKRALKKLSIQGVLLLDCFPEELTSPLINSYLNIKARHLL